jgi:hypothetical protein
VISRALHLNVFAQPVKNHFFNNLIVTVLEERALAEELFSPLTFYRFFINKLKLVLLSRRFRISGYHYFQVEFFFDAAQLSPLLV